MRGLLEVYWDGYEAVELNTYADYEYLTEVWTYHRRLVEAICAGDFAGGKQLLIDHMRLLDKLGVAHEGAAPVTRHSAQRRVALPAVSPERTGE